MNNILVHLHSEFQEGKKWYFNTTYHNVNMTYEYLKSISTLNLDLLQLKDNPTYYEIKFKSWFIDAYYTINKLHKHLNKKYHKIPIFDEGGWKKGVIRK